MFSSQAKSIGLAVLVFLTHLIVPAFLVKVSSAENDPVGFRANDASVEEGRVLFERLCFHCHGVRGNGKGPAEIYLDPKPRDFAPGIFKFHSTQNNAPPGDRDLYRTISRGLPGTAMPGFKGTLEDGEIFSLVAYIKTFSRRFSKRIPDYPVEVGPEPAFDDLSIARGKELYRQMRCVRCHGESGEKQGTLPERMGGVWGRASRVFDLRNPGYYKAGPSMEQIYVTLSVGIDGTPMNPYDFLSETDRWHLVHFIRSLFESSPEVRESAPVLVSKKVEAAISLKPDDPVWEDIQPVSVRLNALRVRNRPMVKIFLQSIRNDSRIAFRLSWRDESAETGGQPDREFFDEAALQFSLSGGDVMDRPFHGMGERRKPVNIWHWRADASQRAAGVQPANEKSTGLRRGNVFLESPVEELNARGFGGLNAQSLEDQQLTGRGRWKDGAWTVILRRSLKTPSPFDVQFEAGKSTPVAFALWDGASGDKSAVKLVSYWKVLRVE